jgi:hypothetical protein
MNEALRHAVALIVEVFTHQKAAGSIPDEVTGFSVYLILPAALWP